MRKVRFFDYFIRHEHVVWLAPVVVLRCFSSGKVNELFGRGTHNMSSTVFSRVLLGFYGAANKSGLLKTPILQKAFVQFYFLYKRYLEDCITKLFHRYPDIAAGGDILDIGANVGYSAVLFSQYISPGKRIFAFEPDRKNFATLTDIIGKRNISHVVTAVRAAVGDQDGEIKLRLNDSHHADHRVITESFEKIVAADDRVEIVPLVSIDEFRRSRSLRDPVSLIKIDVQGYEFGVCKGMVDTIEQFPNATIIFEHTPESAIEMGFDADAVPDFFLDRGYSLFLINRNGSIKLVSRDELKQFRGGVYADVLATKVPERFTSLQ